MGACRRKACRKLQGVWSGSFLSTLESVGGVLSSLLVSVQPRILDTQVLVGGRLTRDSMGVGVLASSVRLRVLEKESYTCNL